MPNFGGLAIRYWPNCQPAGAFPQVNAPETLWPTTNFIWICQTLASLKKLAGLLCGQVKPLMGYSAYRVIVSQSACEADGNVYDI